MSEIVHIIRSAGIEFTSDEWAHYFHELRTDKRKPIVTRIGKYDWNDHGLHGLTRIIHE